MRQFLTIPLLLLLGCASDAGPLKEDVSEIEEEFVVEAYEIRWYFEDEFSNEEEVKLKNWIDKVYAATIETLGQYPFDLHVFFHRNDRNKAVTFGHTERGERQAVHFYVNPTFPIEDFIKDWIAPHEIAHLSMPFVGKNAKWYAEGYATYLSRKIMINMDLFTNSEFDSLYLHKIRETLPCYKSTTSTFQEVSDSLLSKYEYGEMYWGSTSFFMTSDSLLHHNYDMSLTNLIKSYQTCCRLEDKSLDDVMQSYDNIIGDTLFNNLLWQYRNLPSYSVMKWYSSN